LDFEVEDFGVDRETEPPGDFPKRLDSAGIAIHPPDGESRHREEKRVAAGSTSHIEHPPAGREEIGIEHEPGSGSERAEHFPGREFTRSAPGGHSTFQVEESGEAAP